MVKNCECFSSLSFACFSLSLRDWVCMWIFFLFVFITSRFYVILQPSYSRVIHFFLIQFFSLFYVFIVIYLCRMHFSLKWIFAEAHPTFSLHLLCFRGLLPTCLSATHLGDFWAFILSPCIP